MNHCRYEFKNNIDYKLIKQIQYFFDKDMPELCQQSNFRLKRPVPTSELKFWMINDRQYVKETDTFKLFRIMTD